MESDEQGVYDDPGTSGQQPNTEHSQPGGEGASSRSGAGASKRDPMSSGPTLGNTIAGRDVDTESNTADTNANPSSSQE